MALNYCVFNLETAVSLPPSCCVRRKRGTLENPTIPIESMYLPRSPPARRPTCCRPTGSIVNMCVRCLPQHRAGEPKRRKSSQQLSEVNISRASGFHGSSLTKLVPCFGVLLLHLSTDSHGFKGCQHGHPPHAQEFRSHRRGTKGFLQAEASLKGGRAKAVVGGWAPHR